MLILNPNQHISPEEPLSFYHVPVVFQLILYYGTLNPKPSGPFKGSRTAGGRREAKKLESGRVQCGGILATWDGRFLAHFFSKGFGTPVEIIISAKY